MTSPTGERYPLKAYTSQQQLHTHLFWVPVSVCWFSGLFFLECMHSSKRNFSQTNPSLLMTSIITLAIFKIFDDPVFEADLWHVQR